MVPPGWYDDGTGTLRWWDGTIWTEHTASGAPTAASGPDAGVTDIPSGIISLHRFPRIIWGLLRRNTALGAVFVALSAVAAVALSAVAAYALPDLNILSLASGDRAAMFGVLTVVALNFLVTGLVTGLAAVLYVSGASGRASGISASFKHVLGRLPQLLLAFGTVVVLFALPAALILALLPAAVPILLVGPLALILLAAAVSSAATLPLYVVSTDATSPVMRFVKASWAGLKLFPALVLIGIALAVLSVPSVMLSQLSAGLPLVVEGAAMLVAFIYNMVLSLCLILSSYLLTLRVDSPRSP